MAPLTVYLLARDEVPSSNALKVPVSAQAKVLITRMLALKRFDVLQIAIDANRRPGARETFRRVVQDDRLARWQAIRFRCRIVLPLSVAHASESSPGYSEAYRLAAFGPWQVGLRAHRRRDSRLDPGTSLSQKSIANARLRHDVARGLRIHLEFLAQPRDVHVDVVRLGLPR